MELRMGSRTECWPGHKCSGYKVEGLRPEWGWNILPKFSHGWLASCSRVVHGPVDSEGLPQILLSKRVPSGRVKGLTVQPLRKWVAQDENKPRPVLVRFRYFLARLSFQSPIQTSKIDRLPAKRYLKRLLARNQNSNPPPKKRSGMNI